MAGMFSTKGMYALRAMADLASHDGWVSLGDVSKRQNISRKYLEQVISLMHKAGYVESQRGKGGGYRLTRKPEEYTLGELLRAAEGLAKQGRDYQGIIKYYFPEARILDTTGAIH